MLRDQEMSANLEGGDLVLDLLPPDCLLGSGYAVLPPLIIRTKWHEQYTEQGPEKADFGRVFRFFQPMEEVSARDRRGNNLVAPAWTIAQWQRRGLIPDP